MNPCYFKGCSYFCLIYKWNEWIELLLSFGLQNHESLRKTKRCFIWITWIILILKELNQKHRSHYLFLITATKYTINITLIHTTTRRKTITKITSFLICSFNSPKILVHFNCLTSETLCLATRNANILLTQVFPHKTILHPAYAKKKKSLKRSTGRDLWWALKNFHLTSLLLFQGSTRSLEHLIFKQSNTLLLHLTNSSSRRWVSKFSTAYLPLQNRAYMCQVI